MLLNSTNFLVFFVVVYAGYLALYRHHKAQNALLLAASLYFYGSWDWRFLGLLAIASGVDFVTALLIHRAESPRRRKLLLVVSLITNLTILGFFKYFGFFVENLARLSHAVGLPLHQPTLAIVLPVGISFYTFQAMSYVIDVYRRDLEPCRSPLDYALFIAFFPHLVAGPIQVPSVLLPQVMKPRTLQWQKINDGIFLIVWGLFKKIVIADNLALIANGVFDGYLRHRGLDTLVGALAFTFQIYCDFSGYSDIARGLSKLLGFELLVNFKLPYFALNPSDFWSRWHVSLSVWLREHLYIPLGGNRVTGWPTYRNLMLTMILGGLWHGASWNFVIWGCFHGAILVIYRLLGWDRDHADPWGRGAGTYPVVLLKMALMFCLTMVGWVIFRSRSVEQIGYILTHIGFTTGPETAVLAYDLLFYAGPLVLIQIYQYLKQDLLVLTRLPALLRTPVYAWMVLWIIIFGVRESTEFIYFQF